MTVHLENTNAGAIALGIAAERFVQGSSAVGRVLTLIIVADEAEQSDATRAAVRASREHPCRILVAIPRPGRSAPRLDAAITVGGSDGLGEVVELRLRGPLAHHTESVLVPLLVPDAPVVVWWPGKAPDVPAEDPVGALGRRRITDCASAARPLAALEKKRTSHRDGDTDLAWTRLTPWRALLAAGLDQPYDKITGGEVHAQQGNASGALLAAWLQSCLGVPFTLRHSRGPGVTMVRLRTRNGDITVARHDGLVACVSRPGFPDREAALPRRTLEELIAEELRRLDPDEILSETLDVLGEITPAGAATRRRRAATKSTTTSRTKSTARGPAKKAAKDTAATGRRSTAAARPKQAAPRTAGAKGRRGGSA
jgi:glucose-6-phosphate dehydrogenase assembly protein OpcA